MATSQQTMLSNVINNDNLLKLGELKFDVTPLVYTTGRYNTMTVTASGGDVVINTHGDGYFTDSAFSANNGTTYTVLSGQTATLYFSNGTYSVHITNKYAISQLILGTSESESHYENWTTETYQLRGMTGLTILRMSNMNLLGDVYNLKSNVNINTLDLSYTEVEGDSIALVASFSNIVTYDFTGSKVNDVTLVFNVDSGTNYFVISAVEGNVEITLDGIYFANSSYTSDGTQTKTITAGQSATVYITKATGKMYIKHAQFISVLKFDNCFATTSFDISQLSGCNNLTQFTFYANYNVYGDIAAFRNCKKLTTLNIYQTKCYGNISALSELTNLQVLSLRYTQVGGDILHLRKLTNLTELRLSISGCYGSVMNLSNCTKLTTLSIQFTAISGNLYKLYQTIPSCTIWYCCNYYHFLYDQPTETDPYNIQWFWGSIAYNYRYSPIKSYNTSWTLGDLYNSWTYNNTTPKLDRRKNNEYHNTTLLFITLS